MILHGGLGLEFSNLIGFIYFLGVTLLHHDIDEYVKRKCGTTTTTLEKIGTTTMQANIEFNHGIFF